MTNKIEKLNARLVNNRKQLEFDLAEISGIKIIDVYERNKPGLIKAITKVSKKIDEVIDESNRNTKSIDALYETFCKLEKYIFKLEERISKLEAAQKQQSIGDHPAKRNYIDG